MVSYCVRSIRIISSVDVLFNLHTSKFLLAELLRATTFSPSHDVSYFISCSVFCLVQSHSSKMDNSTDGSAPPHAWPPHFSRLIDHAPVQKQDDDRPRLPREWSSRKKSSIVALVSSLNFLV